MKRYVFNVTLAVSVVANDEVTAKDMVEDVILMQGFNADIVENLYVMEEEVNAICPVCGSNEVVYWDNDENNTRPIYACDACESAFGEDEIKYI